MDCAQIRESLFALRDESFGDFTSKLLPTVDKSRVIGVRMPQIEKLASTLAAREDVFGFLDALPHCYYEENLLHGAILGSSAMAKRLPFDGLMARLEEFLPYVDNWAVCDSLPPKAFKKHLDEVYARVPIWLYSEKTYTVRFALVTLLTFYLEPETYEPLMLKRAMTLKSDEYYVRMAQAWYMSYALIKQYESALPLIETNALDVWVHNKSIQKAVESYRISPERKAALRALRRK